ncbi:hypothetical protein KL919_002310 [Ogataea angusta]|nr:hypothetical protein KL919_002310 [Ogataea angusta]
MRRCEDDWVNATQILKIAGFGKAQRTRLLEKEVHQFKHQKIQGGYGRFQGTWVPLDFARELAQTHKIPTENSKVLYYDREKDAPLEKRTKTKPPAAQGAGVEARKRKSKVDGDAGHKPNKKVPGFSQTHAPPTFGSVHAYHAQSQAAPPMVPMNTSQYAFSAAQHPYSMKMPAYYAAPAYPGMSQQHVVMQQPQMQRFSHNYNNFGSLSTTDGSQDELRLNRTSSDTSTSSGFESELKHPGELAMDSFAHHQYALSTPSASNILSEHHELENGEFDYYTEKLLSFFGNDDEPIPDFILNPPRDFDINKAIDDEGHTPLHWASALASHPVIQVLIEKNANPLILNGSGMNSLSKLVHFTNSYDLKNFGIILQLLRQCLIVPDAQGRTPLHYIMELTANPNKVNCLSYYFDEIVRFIEFQQSEAERLSAGNKADRDLLQILINHRDKNGDAALRLAVKAGEPRFIARLIKLGADVDEVGLHNIPPAVVQELRLDRYESVEPAKFRTPTRFAAEDDNKENVFEDNSTITNSSVAGKDDAAQLLKLETPRSPGSRADDLAAADSFVDSLRLFESRLASLMQSLNESVKAELGTKEEELAHNLETIRQMESEVQQLGAKTDRLMEQLLRDADDDDRRVLESAAFEPHTVHGLLDKYEQQLHEKHEQLVNMYERSQALELAKLVHQEETQISGAAEQGTAAKRVELAVQLTSLQIERRGLIGSITASLSGVSDCEEGDAAALEERRMQAKLYLYRKLIASICNLPFEEIDQDLLTGIETRLLEAKT